MQAVGELDQPARLVLDDVHDVHAEVGDHAFGHHRADALDQARTEVLLMPAAVAGSTVA